MDLLLQHRSLDGAAISFEEKAKRALEGFHSSRWNSGYIKFIAENLEKIERAAQGEEAVYPIMTIYKNVKTGELEVEG